MELISYEQFGKLRLRDHVPDPASIAETAGWEWMDSVWLNDGIGFTSFSRHVTSPEQTGGMEVYFPELPPDYSQRLLAAIGLPLRPGMGLEEVHAILGQPIMTYQFVPDRCTCDYAVGSSQSYVVGCTVHETDGLIHVTVIRSDLIPHDEPRA